MAQSDGQVAKQSERYGIMKGEMKSFASEFSREKKEKDAATGKINVLSSKQKYDESYQTNTVKSY